ncbi:MAG TPA: hypothetical protein VGJ37_09220 [Pyrinomonadaceae bacterium]
MKNFVVVCLVLLAAALPVYAQHSAEELSPFTLAERVGEGNARSFFLFSTSAGNYALRHDGMGEVTSPAGMRKVFNVKAGSRGRIERVYSFEYQGDLLLLYEAGDSGYLVRLSQKTRKVKAVVTVDRDFAPPVIKDQRVVFSDGTVVSLN